MNRIVVKRECINTSKCLENCLAQAVLKKYSFPAIVPFQRGLGICKVQVPEQASEIFQPLDMSTAPLPACFISYLSSLPQEAQA